MSGQGDDRKLSRVSAAVHQTENRGRVRQLPWQANQGYGHVSSPDQLARMPARAFRPLLGASLGGAQGQVEAAGLHLALAPSKEIAREAIASERTFRHFLQVLARDLGANRCRHQPQSSQPSSSIISFLSFHS